MTEEQIKITALLQTAASRLLQAAVSTNKMRMAHLSCDAVASAEAACALAVHMEVVEQALLDSWRLIETQSAAAKTLNLIPGGLVN